MTMRTTMTQAGLILSIQLSTGTSIKCKENGPSVHLVWSLVFDEQQDQVRQTCLRVFIL